MMQSGVLLLIFLLAHHIYAKAHDRRKKKTDMLVDMVGDILKQVGKAHEIILENAGQQSLSVRNRILLNSALRDYSNAINDLEEAQIHSLHIPDTPGFEQLRRDREQYKDRVTAAPYPTSLPLTLLLDESNFYKLARSNLRNFQLQLVGPA